MQNGFVCIKNQEYQPLDNNFTQMQNAHILQYNNKFVTQFFFFFVPRIYHINQYAIYKYKLITYDFFFFCFKNYIKTFKETMKI